MSPLGIAIFIFNRNDSHIWLEIGGYFLILGLIAAAVGLESNQKLRVRIQYLKDAIQAGSVVEHHIVNSRCFMVEDEDDGSDYYFDLGEDGTIVVNDLMIENDEFPAVDTSLARILGADGRPLDLVSRCEGRRLSPLETLPRQDLWKHPDTHRLAEIETFTILPERFDDLLAQVKRHRLPSG